MNRGRSLGHRLQSAIGIVRGLYESRLMTLAHVASLYFNGKSEAAKKRKQRFEMRGSLANAPGGV